MMRLLLLFLSAATVGVFGLDLKSASPAKDSIIEDPPLKVILTFSEKVRPEGSAISILHRDTTEFIKLDVKVGEAPEIIEALVPRKLLGGHYLVRWKTVAADGTTLSGLYPFVVDFPE